MITFVCGELCSGKTVYSKAFAELTKAKYIEVGDIVREIKQSENRKILQDSKKLSSTIVINLQEIMWKELTKDLVISGVRQKSILKAFPCSTLVWIDCPKKEREKRYEKRAREGDTISFKEAEKGDIALGILKVKKYILRKK
jgi:dephospho-CoA kinase